MKNKFKRIWLQDAVEYDDITWCEDKIHDTDAEYILADLHRGELAVLETRAEAAEAELAAMKEAERWIPVGERLPNLRCFVLFVAEYFGEKTLFHGARYKDGWYSVGSVECHCDVTHWRPLPAPPEVEE